VSIALKALAPNYWLRAVAERGYNVAPECGSQSGTVYDYVLMILSHSLALYQVTKFEIPLISQDIHHSPILLPLKRQFLPRNNGAGPDPAGPDSRTTPFAKGLGSLDLSNLATTTSSCTVCVTVSPPPRVLPFCYMARRTKSKRSLHGFTINS
jgi:hypothetical protein